MTSREPDFGPEISLTGAPAGLSRNRKLLFQILAAGLILIPNLGGLFYIGPINFLRQIGEVSLSAWQSLVLSQVPSLAIGLLLLFSSLWCRSVPAVLAGVLFVPLLLFHCWLSIWLMFVSQYNQGAIAFMAFVAAAVCSTVFFLMHSIKGNPVLKA